MRLKELETVADVVSEEKISEFEIKAFEKMAAAMYEIGNRALDRNADKLRARGIDPESLKMYI